MHFLRSETSHLRLQLEFILRARYKTDLSKFEGCHNLFLNETWNYELAEDVASFETVYNITSEQRVRNNKPELFVYV